MIFFESLLQLLGYKSRQSRSWLENHLFEPLREATHTIATLGHPLKEMDHLCQVFSYNTFILILMFLHKYWEGLLYKIYIAEKPLELHKSAT